jgi:hypothetical protein
MTFNGLRKFVHIAASCIKLISKIKKIFADKERMSLHPMQLIENLYQALFDNRI